MELLSNIIETAAVLLLIAAIIGWGFLKMFGPMMASRALEASEKRSQWIGCGIFLAGLGLLGYVIYGWIWG